MTFRKLMADIAERKILGTPDLKAVWDEYVEKGDFGGNCLYGAFRCQVGLSGRRSLSAVA